jgi:hypothetical protein
LSELLIGPTHVTPNAQRDQEHAEHDGVDPQRRGTSCRGASPAPNVFSPSCIDSPRKWLHAVSRSFRTAMTLTHLGSKGDVRHDQRLFATLPDLPLGVIWGSPASLWAIFDIS